MEKCCLYASSFIFDRIIIKVAATQDRHKSSDEFDFRLDQTTHFWVTCPWMMNILHFQTWMRHQLANLDQILCVASLGGGGGGGRLHNVLRQIGQSGVHGNRKDPLIYNGENGVSTFSRLLLVRSFLYLQIMRTCIKSRTSSNFGQMGPLTLVSMATERPHWFIMGKMVSPPFLGCFWSDPFYSCW